MSNGQKASQVSGCVNGVLADPRAYFFSLIGSTEGAPAPDWKAVLESLPGRGMGTNPKPGEKQPLNAPHYGITVMIDGPTASPRDKRHGPGEYAARTVGSAWEVDGGVVVEGGDLEPGTLQPVTVTGSAAYDLFARVESANLLLPLVKGPK